MLENIKQKVLRGELATKEEMMTLLTADLSELLLAAQEIRRAFCGKAFDVCAIVNGKSGGCSENCKYCAQSVHYNTDIREYPLVSPGDVAEKAAVFGGKGVLRMAVVTSGRGLLDTETAALAQIYQRVKAQDCISLCASHGILTYEQLMVLKKAGVRRYHHNLETSRRYFPKICTTHSYDDRIATVKAAKKAGLSLCSGGIIGMGETLEDRIDMFFDLQALAVDSVPINLLNPIPGTPLEDCPALGTEEIYRTVALGRLILPGAVLRLAGGRGNMADQGKGLFAAGINGVITGEMLTTHGISIDTDLQLIKESGFEVTR